MKIVHTNDATPVLRYLYGNHNHEVCIILDYVPPFPDMGSKPYGAVVYNRKRDSFLRGGINHEHLWWDVYGDDYGNVTAALAAIKQMRKQQAALPAGTGGEG